MSELLTQVAALAVLMTMGELLLPDGKLRGTARLAMSLLMTTVLVGALIGALNAVKGNGQAATALAGGVIRQTEAKLEEQRVDAFLTAQANQGARLCEKLARNAGYEGGARVLYTREGVLARVELMLREKSPLIDRKAMMSAIADALETDTEKIVWMTDETD
ncbi:MAG: hypothetical protein EOM69_11965 [Clostridia bacterium]|nr:hypothetical protein [Clostridia bacterium]